jgi:hypothetical protein
MTDDRSLERAARSWLEEGPTRAPDRPVEAALARIDTTRQERALPILWRFQIMRDSTRLATIAATVAVVAIGGLYLAGLGRPSDPGGSGATATPMPSVSPTQGIEALGTVTLLEDSCTWDGNPGTIAASSDPVRLTVNVRNDTDTFANFGVYRLDEGYPWADAEAWIIRENEALHGGPSQPPQDFATDVASLDQPTTGQGPPANLALGPGTYGIVCSSNEPPPGLVFAVYVVGPLQIMEP